MGFLMSPHPLTNFEIQKYYKNEPAFFQETIYFKNIKDGTYIINLDEYADVGIHWIALFCKENEIVYFDSFGVEHVPEEMKEFIDCRSLNSSTLYCPSSSASQNKNKSQHFSSTSKRFSNVWLLLHRIY